MLDRVYKDFRDNRDATDEHQVANACTLEIAIEGGRQVSPPQNDQNLVANILEIFTGTVVFEEFGSDNELLRGVVRVRLGFTLAGNIKYVGSGSVAALASLHGDNESSLWAVDAVQVATEPTAGGTLPGDGLPDNELYLILYAAVSGPHAALLRLAYQANVLIQDTTPDLASILVRQAGSAAAFDTNAQVEIGSAWEYQLTATGPVVDSPLRITLDSDRSNVPIGVDFRDLLPGQEASSWPALPTPNTAREGVYTITALGKRVTRTATVTLYPLQ
jgi:hypothetical protein